MAPLVMKRRADHLIFLFILAALVWVFAILPPLGLSSNDEGARYIQMKNFNLYGSGIIQYPGATLGLKAGEAVKQEGLFVERGGRLYSTFPPLFTYVSSLFYPLLGDRVTTFLPLIAFLLSVIALCGTLRLLLQDRPVHYLLLFGFLLASPVYLHAFRFVEHVPAVCCVVCSLYFLVRYFRVKPSVSNLCVSAALLSIGIFFRPEVMLLAIPYAGYVSFTLCLQKQAKRASTVLACSILPIVLYGLLNRRFYGSTLLLHLFYNSLGFHLSGSQTALAVATVLFSIAIALLGRRSKAEPWLKGQVYAFTAVLFIPFMLLVSAFSPISGLFLAFPLVLLVFFGISERVEKLLSEPFSLGNILFITTIGFLFLVSWPFANSGAGNVAYCLSVVPFIIAIVAHEEKSIISARPMVALVFALLIFSACYQAYTFKRSIWNYKQYNAERIQFLKTATKPRDIIICDAQPLLEHGGPLFFERTFVVAESRCELSRYARLLKEKGIARAYLWTNFCCLPKDTSFTASSPAVFSSSHGPKNYLFTLSMRP